MLEWLKNLFDIDHLLHIDLARVQLEERRERREAFERELSDMATRECIARVRRRMELGDSVWIPPLYNADKSWHAWRRSHRRRRIEMLELRRRA